MAAALVAAVLAALLGVLVHTTHGIVALDEQLNSGLTPYRSAAWVAVAMFVTGLGSTSTVAAVIIVVSGVLWAHGQRVLLPPMWLTFAGAELVTTLVKYGMDRARPVFTTLATAMSPSFPSGHTTGAAAVYGFVAYAIARDLPQRRRRVLIGVWAALVIVAVGLSRVFLGVHFASDVIAGWLIGACWLLVGFAVAEARRT